ncbi:uncharacterized protein MKZ38_003703 [Zalerion maritima]|uniref:Cytochrome c oxidase subunit 4, mitochondrial n=1 Tax=Zalerion maritima TaxID=339359 RepID=A0AAD5WUJ5_9PEZI|nr:uncharacterized protein MKZ38_003703 [Zalerion maritima]
MEVSQGGDAQLGVRPSPVDDMARGWLFLLSPTPQFRQGNSANPLWLHQIRPSSDLSKLAFLPDDDHDDQQKPLHSSPNPTATMFLQRSAIIAARRAAATPIVRRTITTTVVRRDAKQPAKTEDTPAMKALGDIRTDEDLIGPGAKPGTVPTDLDQATGLERLEILGKMEGVDVFNMKPLDASRKGTLSEPIMVRSAGEEQYAGCTGYPADSHVVTWLTMSRERPVNRCPECGSVYKMEYVGPTDDHGHDHHGYVEPKTFADYVKPKYY